MDKASKHIDSFSKRTEATLQRTGNAFKGLFAGITINTIARLADEYKKFDAQLKLATNTVEDYNKAYSNVIRIGRVSMSDIGAIGVLYARLTNNLKDYGTTQKEVSDITESVSLALRVSNATVQETNSVMLQLSQSFGSGRINGQEFLAVMEGAPILMRQLAKSIGIPFGELKKLSEQGKLNADLL
jgi:tape measure domain-containing protein